MMACQVSVGDVALGGGTHEDPMPVAPAVAQRNNTAHSEELELVDTAQAASALARVSSFSVASQLRARVAPMHAAWVGRDTANAPVAGLTSERRVAMAFGKPGALPPMASS